MMAEIPHVLSAILILLGTVMCLIGGWGILRFPEFYTRTHAASITDTMGAGLVLTGLMVESGFTLLMVKVAMIGIFLLLTSPTSGHALVKAAYAQGLRFPKNQEGPDGPSV